MLFLKSEPAGARTQDPVIKSHMLYQLSYRPSKEEISKHWKLFLQPLEKTKGEGSAFFQGLENA